MNQIGSESAGRGKIFNRTDFQGKSCFGREIVMGSYTISEGDRAKLDALGNPKVWRVVGKAAELMGPKEVMVFTDDPEELDRVRQLAIESGEEKPLAMEGHTIHYDGYYDLARDKGNTAVLLPSGRKLSRGLNVVEREAGLKEMSGLLDGSMRGKTMIVRFFCLGPTNSRFSLCALQVTDSLYVAHSEDILYRPGYEQFKRLKDKDDFFYFWHSAGELDERGCTKNTSKRKIYIDPLEGRVFSVNNQYAGNSLACKKLALRLAIWKASEEGWLAEHLFISAFGPVDGSRKTYFSGAYPSACGKTSTAMLPGASIVGDDIAYLRDGQGGEMRGVNIECGIFGIIKDVNALDDPVIFETLTSPKELIFSNILTTGDGKAYWDGMGEDIIIPKKGYNHSGAWHEGKVDKEGSIIPVSHPNARFTCRIRDLSNADDKLHDPKGVKIDAILYGGRDSDTCVPVAESLSWEHGVFIGATLESETTTATLGAVGNRSSSPMANMDFVIIPLGKYLSNHIAFGRRLKHCPKVFGMNYFLKNASGQYINSKLDKKVWLHWAEGRIHGEFEAIKTPIGYLPRFEDLKDLFDKALGKVYHRHEYEEQFAIRIRHYLEKFDRMEEIFRDEPQMPKEFWQVLSQQRKEIIALREKTEKDIVSPFEL